MANSVLRQIRLFAYFVVGLLIGGLSVNAFAGEKYPVSSSDTNTALQKCGAASVPDGWSITTACYSIVKCPDVRSPGSTCVDSAQRVISISGNNAYQGYTSSYMYCPDSPNYHWDGSQCVVPDPCKSKSGQFDNGGNPQSVQLAGATWYKIPTTDGKLPNPVCINGCYADPYAGYDFLGMGGAGTYEFKGNPKYNGQSCSSSDATGKKTDSVQKNTPEYDCVNSGKAFGYFNGNVMCVDSTSKGGTATKSTTTTNNDGSKTQTDVKSTISCGADGKCSTTTTTTTTTYNSDGTVKGTDTQTKTEDSGGSAGGNGNQKSSFCQENPDSPLCKTGSFGESCSGEPTCNGDPVQCATARAAWKTRCALEPTPAAVTAGQTVLDGDPAASDALKHTSVAMPTVDTTGGGSSGSCPADRVVNIYGDQNLKVPFSSLCAAADLMRVALLAVAGFAAAMIISGGIK